MSGNAGDTNRREAFQESRRFADAYWVEGNEDSTGAVRLMPRGHAAKKYALQVRRYVQHGGTRLRAEFSRDKLAQRRWHHCILLLTSCLNGPVPAAQPALFALPEPMPDGSRWICSCESHPREGWFLRCENIDAAIAYDPVLDHADSQVETTRIPLYGAPYPDSRLAELATAVLCTDTRHCEVAITAL